MAYIDIIDETKAEGKLKELYDDIIAKRGKLSNIMRIHSLMPGTMEKHMELYLSIMFDDSTLSREHKELLAVVVSVANKCPYCINHHAEALNHYWKDDQKIEMIKSDFNYVEMDERTRLSCQYSNTLTTKPEASTEQDIEMLKEAGYTDKEILQITLIVSYFNFVNRIALSLGVDFSEDEISGYKY